MTASQVLVVYNSRSADGQTVLNAYLAAHPDLPAANVFDLNSAAMAGRADVTYAEFIADIRNPIRAYLDQLGDPAPEGIVSLCLIRGIPHRIQDTDYPTVGDNPLAQSNEFGAGDATSASVDSELVLLWQNLETDEAGLSMDSKSDSVIDNPYHGLLTSIKGHPSTSIKTAKTFGKSS